MDDELREMVLNAVFLLYKGKGIMSHPRVKVNSRLIVEQISASTGKEIDRDNIRTAIFELCQGGYLKEHIERSSFKSKNPFTGKTETVKDQHSMYSIKEKGIVHIEGESKFLKEKGH